MPLSKSQKAFVHMAKAACALEDAEYREIWATLFPGITSSADKALGDEHFDKFMKYTEAIYWQMRREGKAYSCKVFSRPHYWTEKNEAGNTSRDRHALEVVQGHCQELERELLGMGFRHSYCNAISRRVLGANPQVNDWYKYRNALSRTIASKRLAKEEEEKEVTCPF